MFIGGSVLFYDEIRDSATRGLIHFAVGWFLTHLTMIIVLVVFGAGISWAMYKIHGAIAGLNYDLAHVEKPEAKEVQDRAMVLYILIGCVAFPVLFLIAEEMQWI